MKIKSNNGQKFLELNFFKNDKYFFVQQEKNKFQIKTQKSFSNKKLKNKWCTILISQKRAYFCDALQKTKVP